MPPRLLPKPWKRSSYNGFHYIPFGRGFMMFNPKKSEWLYNVKRGESDFCDNWGPWHGPFSALEKITAEFSKWEKSLQKAGWFKMKLSEDAITGKSFTKADRETLNSHVLRLPRCSIIPYYHLESADAYRVAKGIPVSKNMLRVGGSDICIEETRDRWDHRVKSETKITFRPPGGRMYGEGTRRLNLDAASLEALIKFLMAERVKLVSQDASQAASIQVSEHAVGEDMWDRWEKRLDASAEISALFKELQNASFEEVRTARQMLSMIRSKEMAVEFVYAEGEGEPPPQSSLH